MPEKPKPTTRRRNYEKNAETRELLINTAVEILKTSGFNAVSARKVAGKAGLSHQIVHYYFQSMEELFLEIIHRSSMKHMKELKAAKKSDQPLWEAWALMNKKDSGRMETEFLAIANRYTSAQGILRKTKNQYNKELVALFSEMYDRYQLELGSFTPSIASTAINAIARTMALEATHGPIQGHSEIKTFVENFIAELEGPRGRPIGG